MMGDDFTLSRSVGDEVILDSWPSCAKQSKIYQLNFRQAAYFCTISNVRILKNVQLPLGLTNIKFIL